MKYAIILILSTLIIGCCKDNSNSPSGIDCERFADSFISVDYEYAKLVIDSICQTLPPVPTDDDELGHELNTKTLVNHINEKCSELTVEIECYACLESSPPQSSFTITLDSINISIKRNFRLRVPEADFMYMN